MIIPPTLPAAILIMLLVAAATVWYSPRGLEWLAYLLECRALALRCYTQAWTMARKGLVPKLEEELKHDIR